MFGPKLKVSDNLMKKIKIASEILGVVSVDEFVSKVLETECDKVIASTGKRDATAEEVDDIANKLKGLGYLE